MLSTTVVADRNHETSCKVRPMACHLHPGLLSSFLLDDFARWILMTQPRQTYQWFEAATLIQNAGLRRAVRLLVLYLVGHTIILVAGSASAGVVLRLRDGRHAVGDTIRRAAAGSRFILLSRRSGHAVLTRRIVIGDVDSVRIDGRIYTQKTLLRHLDEGRGTATARQPIVPIYFRSRSSQPPLPLPSSDAPSLKMPEASSAQTRTTSSMIRPAGCCGESFYPILGLEGVVIGVQDDPLSAYRDDVKRFFPHGVPLAETGFARDVLRERRARQVIESDFQNVPPAPVSLPAVQRSGKRLSPSSRPKRPDWRSSISGGRRSRDLIRGITVDATPVSLHGKADWDALLVDVRGFDWSGRPVTIDGTLSTTLWGESQRLVRAFGDRFGVRRGRVRQLATWTRTARSGTQIESEFMEDEVAGRISTGVIVNDPGSQRFLLPLPRPLPEHDPRTGAIGSLHVRLAVPGQGVFEATRPGVLLKHISPLRDRVLMQTGSRFFATESTFGSRRAGPVMSFSSSSRPNGGLLPVQP